MSNSSPRLNLIDRLSNKAEAEQAATGGLPIVERAIDVLDGHPTGSQEPLTSTGTNAGPSSIGQSFNGSADHAMAPAEQGSAVWETAETSGYVELNLNKMKKAGYITPDGRRSRIKEQFRVIKRPLLINAFQQETRRENGNVMLVTSACPNEGKTFVSTNLAMSIAAEREIKVLLMDADVIRQDLSHRFGIQAERGYLDYLAGADIPISDMIVRTSIPSLAILPCGQAKEEAPELFASGRMGDLIDELSSQFSDRVILIDSPPALASSETYSLAMHAGQIAMVVESGKTNRGRLEEALVLLSPCEQIYFILNKAVDSNLSDRYGSYSEYYTYTT